jgi:hypothetical protein
MSLATESHFISVKRHCIDVNSYFISVANHVIGDGKLCEQCVVLAFGQSVRYTIVVVSVVDYYSCQCDSSSDSVSHRLL